MAHLRPDYGGGDVSRGQGCKGKVKEPQILSHRAPPASAFGARDPNAARCAREQIFAGLGENLGDEKRLWTLCFSAVCNLQRPSGAGF